MHFLSRNPDGVSRTALMKWLFLYNRALPGSVSRYDFVPYKYGPYSFEAFRDIQHSMARLVELGDEKVCIRKGCEAEVLEQSRKLPKPEAQVAEGIWLRCR